MADELTTENIFGYPRNSWSVLDAPIVLKDRNNGETPMVAIDLRDDDVEPWINLAVIDGADNKPNRYRPTMWQSISVGEIDDLITALQYAKGVLTGEFKE